MHTPEAEQHINCQIKLSMLRFKHWVAPTYPVSTCAFKQALNNLWPQKITRQAIWSFVRGGSGVSWELGKLKHSNTAEVPHFRSLFAFARTTSPDRSWTISWIFGVHVLGMLFPWMTGSVGATHLKCSEETADDRTLTLKLITLKTRVDSGTGCLIYILIYSSKQEQQWTTACIHYIETADSTAYLQPTTTSKRTFLCFRWPCGSCSRPCGCCWCRGKIDSG